MKKSIAWHKENVRTKRLYLDDLLRGFQHHQTKVDEMKANIAIYQYQIDEAIRLKKDGFDPDKFRRTKKGKEKCELPY